MYINKEKILQSKIKTIPYIEQQYELLKKDDTPVNRVAFLNLFRSQPHSEIISHFNYLCEFPTSGPEFMTSYLATRDISIAELAQIKQMIQDYINKCENNDCEHCDDLRKVIDGIDLKINCRSSLTYMRESTLQKFAIDRVDVKGIYESYFADDIDVIINNINYNPETIIHFEKIIREIKKSKSSSVILAFPSLYVKCTDLVITLNTSSMNSAYDVIVKFPADLAHKAIDSKVSKSQIKEFIKVINIQIGRIYAELKNGDPKKYTVYTAYLDQLKRANELLCKQANVLKESIADMQPEIKLYEDCVIEDITAELEDSIANLVFDDESEEELGSQAIENFVRAYRTMEAYVRYQGVTEESKVTKGVVRTAHKAEKVTRKVAGAVNTGGSNINRVKTAVNKVTDPLVATINKTIDNIKKMDSDERRERIITGQFRYKLFNTLTKAIAGVASGKLIAIGVGASASSVIGPILALIGVIASFAINKKLDEKERKKILQELESELTIVNEKIDDAKGDGAREKKYELMRIKQKLEKDIERIKYHLN